MYNIYSKALRAHSATVPFRFLACLDQHRSQNSENILGGCIADEQNCQLSLCGRAHDPSALPLRTQVIGWRTTSVSLFRRRMDTTTNRTPARVKGREMNTKAPKRDPRGHPFSQLWMTPSWGVFGAPWEPRVSFQRICLKKVFQRSQFWSSFFIDLRKDILSENVFLACILHV